MSTVNLKTNLNSLNCMLQIAAAEGIVLYKAIIAMRRNPSLYTQERIDTISKRKSEVYNDLGQIQKMIDEANGLTVDLSHPNDEYTYKDEVWKTQVRTAVEA